MKLDKSYTVEKHAAYVMKLIEEKIGDGIYPSNDDVVDFWNAVSNPMPPRTFMYILQTKGDRPFRSKGFSLLGLPDAWTFSASQMLGITHENQRAFVAYQTFSLYEVFLSHPELIKDIGVVYCTSRGIKNAAEEDSYFLAHQIAHPIQYDVNGYVTKYFCSYRILGEYKGEALETQIFADPLYSKEQNSLRVILNEVKQGMLAVPQFTKTERRIIKRLGKDINLTANEIAEMEDSKEKTILNHFNKINYKARIAFPLNDFKTVKDVVKYLKRQLII